MTRGSEPEEPPIRFRDSRKIDPKTGQARTPAGGESSPPVAGEDELADLAADIDGPAAAGDLTDGARDENAKLLEERTHDLQRVSAEYANYRKRADRERLAAGELSVGRTLLELLPVADDLDRAKAHGDLTGALKSIADKLDAAFAKLGLVGFGEVGDPFDPSMHEAVLHDESDTVDVPTCTTLMRVGYRHGERLLRPAMVGVTDPTHPAAPSAADAGDASTAGDASRDTGGKDQTDAGPTEEAVVEDATASSERTASPEDESGS